MVEVAIGVDWLKGYGVDRSKGYMDIRPAAESSARLRASEIRIIFFITALLMGGAEFVAQSIMLGVFVVVVPALVHGAGVSEVVVWALLIMAIRAPSVFVYLLIPFRGDVSRYVTPRYTRHRRPASVWLKVVGRRLFYAPVVVASAVVFSLNVSGLIRIVSLTAGSTAAAVVVDKVLFRCTSRWRQVGPRRR